MREEDLTSYFRARLDLDAFSRIDDSMNGLQVGASGRDIATIACAVDATLETFEAAFEAGADAVFVHHGLFWGKPIAVTRSHRMRLAYLLEKDMALFAAHLPLDAHPDLGNNAVMARLLEVVDPKPFGVYHGTCIGYSGALAKEMDARQIAQRLGLSEQTGLKILPFGPSVIRTVGIVSGGAAFEVQQAAAQGFDAYITGEASHSMHAFCREEGITMICGGHYATEVFGPRAIAADLQASCPIRTLFLELPTAL